MNDMIPSGVLEQLSGTDQPSVFATVSTYPWKDAARRVVNDWWTWKDLKACMHDGRFMAAMRAMQADLIRTHFPAMDAESKKRAHRTLAWLENNEWSKAA